MLFILLFAFLCGLSRAQRPDDATLCDYYAENLYGDKSNASQAKLVRSIVSLAFGGPEGLQNVSEELTGILHPGNFEGISVDLQPWFNGSIDSTNLNNAPVGINWLDQGTQPLSDFLTGSTDTVQINNSTNQFRLFSHFFTAFSFVFACSAPIRPPSTGETGGTQRLSLAYVHKFMSLKHEHLGHFINQFGLSAEYFGFSKQDVDTFTGNLNSQYNIRCAPAISLNPTQKPELLSLCQDPTCPLAAPKSDCQAYVNLQPGGYSANGSTPASSTSPPSSSTTPPSSTTSSSSTGTGTAPAQTSDPANRSASSSDSNKLSGGAIAGIAIGSAVVVLMAVALLLFFFRKRKQDQKGPDQFTPSSAYASPAYTDAHASYVSNNIPSPMHQAHVNVAHWNGPPNPAAPIAEMDSGHSPEMAASNTWDNIYPPSQTSPGLGRR